MDPREARRQAFLNRQQKSKQTSEGMGLGFFKGNLQGVNFWKCDEGDHDLDIIGYNAGPNDPDTPEGEWTYVLEVYEHRDVGGVEGASYICMMKTYGQPCPVCDHRQQLIKEGADDDLIKELRTSRYPRSIYNVIVYDSQKEEEKGVQVFHTSHYLMEMHLTKLAESTRRDIAQGHPPYKFFADPEEGYSVRFTRQGTKMNTKYFGHQLVPRNYQISPEIEAAAYQLDQLIHIPTYEEVYKAYWGQDMDETMAPGVSASPRGAAVSVSPRGGAPVHAPHTPPQGTQPATTGGPMPSTAPPQTTAQVPPADTPIFYDEQGNEYVCPGGGIFAVNSYELQHCEQCEIWQPCSMASDQLAVDATNAYDQSQGQQAAPLQTAPPQTQPMGRGAGPVGGRGAPVTGGGPAPGAGSPTPGVQAPGAAPTMGRGPVVGRGGPQTVAKKPAPKQAPGGRGTGMPRRTVVR